MYSMISRAKVTKFTKKTFSNYDFMQIVNKITKFFNKIAPITDAITAHIIYAIPEDI